MIPKRGEHCPSDLRNTALGTSKSAACCARSLPVKSNPFTISPFLAYAHPSLRFKENREKGAAVTTKIGSCVMLW